MIPQKAQDILDRLKGDGDLNNHEYNYLTNLLTLPNITYVTSTVNNHPYTIKPSYQHTIINPFKVDC